jgi:hypothetical protein
LALQNEGIVLASRQSGFPDLIQITCEIPDMALKEYPAVQGYAAYRNTF